MNTISCSKVFLVLLVTLLPNQILADQKLISSACNLTLYKQLCTQTLQNDPDGSKATSFEVLSKVALKHATSTATQIHDKVISLLKGSSSDKALKDCKENYEDALDQLGRSTTALASKRYNDVNTWVSAAMSDADSCDGGFSDVGTAKNPLGSQGTTFSNLCSIVLAITNQLK
ncbi:pectinesterase inhibitor-like [Corylus avellana]|uniref:pectinesterase inhibitor-like n=1 Tax=Corylus avellana TaxID=13451 RepID=UPI001E2000D7|nr:pectinesterase inhibitor-like [Corylus avellana]